MTHERKSQLMDADSVRRALMRITHEIVERNHGAENLCLVGILRRGAFLAQMIRDNLKLVEGKEIPCGDLDITLYRDDLSTLGEMPVVKSSHIPFDITGKNIVLVDDVLYTGRTARAAIEALFKLGRPASIQFAVLVDRGHRELPIRADFVGKNIPTAREEMISVLIPALDHESGVFLCDKRN